MMKYSEYAQRLLCAIDHCNRGTGRTHIMIKGVEANPTSVIVVHDRRYADQLKAAYNLNHKVITLDGAKGYALDGIHAYRNRPSRTWLCFAGWNQGDRSQRQADQSTASARGGKLKGYSSLEMCLQRIDDLEKENKALREFVKYCAKRFDPECGYNHKLVVGMNEKAKQLLDSLGGGV